MIQRKASGKINFVMWQQKKQFRAGIRDWTSSVKLLEQVHYNYRTLDNNHISDRRRDSLFSEIEKIHTNILSLPTPYFSKRSEKEKAFTEMKKK